MGPPAPECDLKLCTYLHRILRFDGLGFIIKYAANQLHIVGLDNETGFAMFIQRIVYSVGCNVSNFFFFLRAFALFYFTAKQVKLLCPYM